MTEREKIVLKLDETRGLPQGMTIIHAPADTAAEGHVSAVLAAVLCFLRRAILVFAGLSCFSVTLGFAGLAMGLSEGAFLLFVTCASSLAGLALLGFAHVLMTERDEPEVLVLRADDDISRGRFDVPIDGWSKDHD